MDSHIKTIDNGTIWYLDSGTETRSENVRIEIHTHWVKIGGPMPSWLPREQVLMVMER